MLPGRLGLGAPLQAAVAHQVLELPKGFLKWFQAIEGHVFENNNFVSCPNMFVEMSSARVGQEPPEYCVTRCTWLWGSVADRCGLPGPLPWSTLKSYRGLLRMDWATGSVSAVAYRGARGVA